MSARAAAEVHPDHGVADRVALRKVVQDELFRVVAELAVDHALRRHPLPEDEAIVVHGSRVNRFF